MELALMILRMTEYKTKKRTPLRSLGAATYGWR
jgi:hypothetical protein